MTKAVLRSRSADSESCMPSGVYVRAGPETDEWPRRGAGAAAGGRGGGPTWFGCPAEAPRRCPRRPTDGQCRAGRIRKAFGTGLSLSGALPKVKTRPGHVAPHPSPGGDGLREPYSQNLPTPASLYTYVRLVVHSLAATSDERRDLHARRPRPPVREGGDSKTRRGSDIGCRLGSSPPLAEPSAGLLPVRGARGRPSRVPVRT
jgi:hypothetical protein